MKRHSLICMLTVSVFIMLFVAVVEAQDNKWDQHARNTSERRDPSSSFYDPPPAEEGSLLSLCVPFAIAAVVIMVWVFATFLEKREKQLQAKQ